MQLCWEVFLLDESLAHGKAPADGEDSELLRSGEAVRGEERDRVGSGELRSRRREHGGTRRRKGHQRFRVAGRRDVRRVASVRGAWTSQGLPKSPAAILG